MSITAKHIIVKGKVQGVFFRKHTKKKADELNITGRVKNTDDGHVEIVAQANEDALKKLIEWCKQGPPHATVKEVVTKDVEPDDRLIDFIVDR